MAKQEKLVVLTEQELEELIERVAYGAANRANNQLYKGLEQRFLHKLEDDMRVAIGMLDDLMHDSRL